MVESGATEAYERMVADIKERVGYEEYPPVMEEITEYGADQGWGGFTYTTECARVLSRAQRRNLGSPV